MKFTRTHEFEYDTHTLFKGELVWKGSEYEVKGFHVIVYMRDVPEDVTAAFDDKQLAHFEELFLEDVRRKLIESA